MPENVSSAQSLWLAQNQRYLMASIAGVYAALLHKDGAPADTPAGQGMPPGALEQEIAASQAALSAPAALDVLGRRLALSPFERATLLACAGLELDAKFAVEFDPVGSRPLCFARLLSTLPSAHWTALVPSAPLRRYGLIALGSAASLLQAPLRIEERVLHFLTGVSFVEPRLRPFLVPVAPPASQPPSLQDLSDRVTRHLQDTAVSASSGLAMIYLCGAHLPTQLEVAASAVAAAGLSLFKLDASAISLGGEELTQLQRQCERECLLHGAALAVVCPDDVSEERRQLAQSFGTGFEIPTLFIARDAPRDLDARVFRLRDKVPSLAEQRQLWCEALGGLARQSHPPAEFDILVNDGRERKEFARDWES